MHTKKVSVHHFLMQDMVNKNIPFFLSSSMFHSPTLHFELMHLTHLTLTIFFEIIMTMGHLSTLGGGGREQEGREGHPSTLALRV